MRCEGTVLLGTVYCIPFPVRVADLRTSCTVVHFLTKQFFYPINPVNMTSSDDVNISRNSTIMTPHEIFERRITTSRDKKLAN